MQTYVEMKSVLSTELNDFEGIFYAFSDQQFRDGMAKLGLKTEYDKISSLGGGGYILKERIAEFKAMFARHSAVRKEFLSVEENLVNAIEYELGNHEYCISGDIEPALEALGLKETDVSPAVLRRAIELNDLNFIDC